MSRLGQSLIGFDRKIQIEWLDAAAGRLATGSTPKDVRTYVWDLLEGTVAGDSTDTSRRKTLTIISRIWLAVPDEVCSLRDAALEHFARATPIERLTLHWAMTTVAYPFFLDLAASVGKLIRLNGSVRLSHISRRLVETWGDRSTVPRATQRVLRSMVQWGALQDAGTPGSYTSIAKQLPVSSDIAQLLLEGILHAQARAMPFRQLTEHPSLFPFDLQIDIGRLRGSRQLHLYRQGNQLDVVELERPRVAL